MSRFFINRPIVAMVISIVMVIVGVVSFLSLPVAQLPNIVPPEIAVNATYVGADALSNGAYVRVKDVGRVELGSQNYTQTATLNGKPSAVLAVYQLPGSNAVDAAKGVRQLMEQLKARFPPGWTILFLWTQPSP
jgi:multidrug efflux pump subunit AcrB